MNVKIKVSVGSATIECEGSEEFVRDDFLTLVENSVERLRTLQRLVKVEQVDGEEVDSGSRISVPASTLLSVVPSGQPASVSTIAQRLNCESGTTLLMSAALKLTVDGAETFSRQQLLDAMKSASAYYRESYMSNLSKYLDRLVRDGRLNDLGSNRYALAATAHQELLAQMR